MSSCPSCGHLNAAEVKFCGECGTRLQATTGHDAGGAVADVDSLPFAVGSTIAQGRYRLDAVLGQGGMGTVYRATDVSLDRQCALKVLNADLTAHPTARKRMEREARALARIEHPNVVQIRSVFVEGELLAMELEYMSGGDLRGLIEQGTLTPERVATLMQSILSGLQALHEAQLVHRDIKPENVLLDSRGEPKLTDLGVARDDAESGRTRTRLGAVLGTLEYMSPEQIQGLGVDARSDIYACGVMLVQMLTGALPFSAKSDFEWQAAHVQQEPELSQARAAHPGLAEVAACALAKEPDERWPSAAAMAGAVQTVEQSPARQPVVATDAFVRRPYEPTSTRSETKNIKSGGDLRSGSDGGNDSKIGRTMLIIAAALVVGGGVAATQLGGDKPAPKPAGNVISRTDSKNKQQAQAAADAGEPAEAAADAAAVVAAAAAANRAFRNGEYDLAIELNEEIVRKFNGDIKHKSDVDRANWRITECYERKGDVQGHIKSLFTFVDRYKKDRDASDKIFKAWTIVANTYRSRGDNEKEFALWNQIVKEFEKGGYEKNGGAEAAAAAEAEFRLMEPRFDAFMNMKLRANPRMSQTKQMQSLTKQLREMLDLALGPEEKKKNPDTGQEDIVRDGGLYKDYPEKVTPYGAQNWSYAAMLYRAKALEHLARTIYQAPTPEGLSDDEQKEFAAVLKKLGAQIENKAIASLEDALKDADSKGVVNEWVTKLRAAMDKYKPAKATPAKAAAAKAAAAKKPSGTQSLSAKEIASKMASRAQKVSNPKMKVLYLEKAVELDPSNAKYQNLLKIAMAGLDG